MQQGKGILTGLTGLSRGNGSLAGEAGHYLASNRWLGWRAGRPVERGSPVPPGFPGVVRGIISSLIAEARLKPAQIGVVGRGFSFLQRPGSRIRPTPMLGMSVGESKIAAVPMPGARRVTPSVTSDICGKLPLALPRPAPAPPRALRCPRSRSPWPSGSTPCPRPEASTDAGVLGSTRIFSSVETAALDACWNRAMHCPNAARRAFR